MYNHMLPFHLDLQKFTENDYNIDGLDLEKYWYCRPVDIAGILGPKISLSPLKKLLVTKIVGISPNSIMPTSPWRPRQARDFPRQDMGKSAMFPTYSSVKALIFCESLLILFYLCKQHYFLPNCWGPTQFTISYNMPKNAVFVYNVSLLHYLYTKHFITLVDIYITFGPVKFPWIIENESEFSMTCHPFPWINLFRIERHLVYVMENSC